MCVKRQKTQLENIVIALKWANRLRLNAKLTKLEKKRTRLRVRMLLKRHLDSLKLLNKKLSNQLIEEKQKQSSQQLQLNELLLSSIAE